MFYKDQTVQIEQFDPGSYIVRYGGITRENEIIQVSKFGILLSTGDFQVTGSVVERFPPSGLFWKCSASRSIDCSGINKHNKHSLTVE